MCVAESEKKPKGKKRKEAIALEKVKAKKAKFDPTQLQTVTQMQEKLIETDEDLSSE